MASLQEQGLQVYVFTRGVGKDPKKKRKNRHVPCIQFFFIASTMCLQTSTASVVFALVTIAGTIICRARGFNLFCDLVEEIIVESNLL
jgi:hypothetical protein